MRLSVNMGLKQFVIGMAVFVVLLVTLAVTSEYHTSRAEFCGGTCHVMNAYQVTWEHSKHNEVACVDCHYEPGEKVTLKAKFRGLGQLFSYLSDPSAPVRKRVVVSDKTCEASGCHNGEEFRVKELKFTENVSFVHKTHADETIEGQTLHCNTCHIKHTADKHFEVPKEMCFLCHFKEAQFNEGRSRCTLCHEMPTESLQSQKSTDDPDEMPITHQSLDEAKVACDSCHYELIAGNGDIKQENCRDCHHDSSLLEKSADKKLMHERHVTTQQADCLDCHRLIQHREAEFLDTARLNCMGCHPDQHRFQKLLLTGPERGDVPETPNLMYAVRTNCMGCHTKEEHKKGQTLLNGSPQACVACHEDGHDQMAADWKEEVAQELKFAKELEAEALKAIGEAKGRVSAERLGAVRAMLAEARENLHIVEYGNGVHNRKYAFLLLDVAIVRYEDLIASLQEEE